MNFKNKVVLVTGSSRGIGRSIAVRFAKEGANVVINYRSNEKEANVITEIISSYGNDCMCYKADVSSEDDVKNMIDSIIKKYGRVDILVNNYFISIDNYFKDICFNDAGKYMLEKKYGKIINISSTNGIDTIYPYSIDYDASKAGLINMTKNLAIEYAPFINVNAVAPGWVDTGMNDDLSKSYLDSEKEKILLKRFADAEEIADVVLFLASDKARYIDGETIRVDGGLKLG